MSRMSGFTVNSQNRIGVGSAIRSAIRASFWSSDIDDFKPRFFDWQTLASDFKEGHEI